MAYQFHSHATLCYPLPPKDINKKNEEFGLSLMLSNVPGGPMSPKFINGTYAALFEEDSDELLEYAKNYKGIPNASKYCLGHTSICRISLDTNLDFIQIIFAEQLHVATEVILFLKID